MRDASLARIQRNRLDPASGADCGDGMSELMKSDDEHLNTWSIRRSNVVDFKMPTLGGLAIGISVVLAYLEWPQTPSHVRNVPQNRNHDDIDGDYTERDLLRVARHTEAAARDDTAGGELSDLRAGSDDGSPGASH